MSRWFRSEPMEYISFIVNEDAAHECLADLGKMGVIQFTDVSCKYRSFFLYYCCVLCILYSFIVFWMYFWLMERKREQPQPQNTPLFCCCCCC
jgi:hypothetical protein